MLVPIAHAVAKRISGGAPDSAVANEVHALRDEVEALRSEVDDMHTRVEGVDDLQNRLDFAERVIGQLKGKPLLPGGDA